MNMEEFNFILKNEKFAVDFNKSGLVNKLRLLKMRSLFSQHFRIPEEKIYSLNTYYKFFSLYINTYSEFDINEVKLDILNNMSDIDICLKYKEPLEVIEEVKKNLKEDILIVDSKYYTTPELCRIFNLGNESILYGRILSKIKINHNGSRFSMWLGSDINRHIGTNLNIKNSTETKMGKMDIITLSALGKALGISNDLLRTRMNNKYRIFGVELKSIGDEIKDLYIKKEDYDKILSNKKYYIIAKDAEIFPIGTPAKVKDVVVSYYSILYNKYINLNSKYIKKENVLKIRNIIKIRENDFCTYFDNLYDAMEQSENNSYNLNKILSAYGNSKAKKILIEMFNIKNDCVDKVVALKIMNYLKNISIYYKKGLTN